MCDVTDLTHSADDSSVGQANDDNHAFTLALFNASVESSYKRDLEDDPGRGNAKKPRRDLETERDQRNYDKGYLNATAVF